MGHEPTGYSDETRDETVSSLTIDDVSTGDQDLSAPDDVVVDNLRDVPPGPYRDRKLAMAFEAANEPESGTDIGNPTSEPDGSGSTDD